jgi:hypothetical protein
MPHPGHVEDPGLVWGGVLECGFIVVFLKNHPLFRLSFRIGFFASKVVF